MLELNFKCIQNEVERLAIMNLCKDIYLVLYRKNGAKGTFSTGFLFGEVWFYVVMWLS
jgi:hypothetical protein